MAASVQVDETLDCKGLLCPMPIVKISKAIKKIEVGQVLEMLATDPGSEADMDAWIRQTGHELVDSTQAGDIYKYYVRRLK